MTDTILTKRQIEDFFQDLTVQMLGLDPRAPENQSRVRVDWQRDGAPAWKIDQDVAFLMVNFDDDQITRQLDIDYVQDLANVDNAVRSAGYTRVLRVSWVFYGPNSFDDADRVLRSLTMPQFRQQLQASNLALIFDFTMPMRSPELFNGQWWDRTSFYARFNEKVVRTSSVPYIQSSDVRIIEG